MASHTTGARAISSRCRRAPRTSTQTRARGPRSSSRSRTCRCSRRSASTAWRPPSMALGFAVFAGVTADIIRASAREAEALGYSSFWVNHPGATDGLAALGEGAKGTRRIELGGGVIPLHTRGPESIAAGVRANALPLDRLLLGVGSPNPGSLARVREGVAELRRTLETRVVVAALGPKMCRLAGEVAD